MPGGYCGARGPDDVAVGALYDRGVYIYALGMTGPYNDDIGGSAAKYVRDHFPQFRPKRILDMGWTVGHSTLPFVDAFPDAEVHAIDVGAPLLRYAHLRAETQGVALHLKQADATATGYDSGYFDLVTSHIMFHETEAEPIPAILAEAYRVLKPGGALLIVDLPDAGRIPDVFQQVVFDGDAYYNNEHFWMKMHDIDWVAQLRKAGFPEGSIEIGFAPMQMYVPPTAKNAEAGWSTGRFGFFAALARKGAERAQ